MPTPMPGDDLAVAVSALALWRMGGCSAGSSSCSRAILQGGMAGGPASIGPPGLSPEVEGGRRRAALSSLRHCAWPAGGGSPAVPRDLRVSEHWNLEPRLEASRALRLGIGLGRAARGLRSSLFRGRRRPVRCMFQRTAHRKPTQRPFNEVVQGYAVGFDTYRKVHVLSEPARWLLLLSPAKQRPEPPSPGPDSVQLESPLIQNRCPHLAPAPGGGGEALPAISSQSEPPRRRLSPSGRAETTPFPDSARAPSASITIAITAIAMASLASSALRRSARSVSCPASAAPLRCAALSRAALVATGRRGPASRRGYVSESRTDKAKVETAIKLDKKDFADIPPPQMGVPTDGKVSPMAEVLKQAAVMEEGQRPIYLDMQSTTPVDPRVLDAMMPFYVGVYGNPHSRTHAYGWESEKAVEEAREHVAKLIGADPKEIIFTSGATESNNMSIKGVARFFGRSGKKKHVITTQTEHKCVLDSCRHLQDEGFEVTYLPVQNNGLIRMEDLEAAIRPETALVSIMAVNNEIGVIQPIEQIGKLCREKKVFFHTDAAQAVGKIPLDVNAMNIDLMSISSHKIYGPKGIGACYVRRRPRVRLDPIITGGGQERGLRSGTLAPPLVAGFGEACRIAYDEMAYDSKRIKALSDRLLQGLLSLEHTSQNGDENAFYPGCVNVSFAYVEGESLLMALKDIALSSGSACTSASLEPSYVLRALGNSDESAHSSIRFGIGRFTTEAEIDYVLKAVQERVNFLRELSPLWELVQEGIDLNTIQWSQH
ncbi:hypothetical protein Purlil1_3905 [Purpureocillium lilacinum]|uniref:cysteine desulfurase n=2 Tax=Purpureocillium lilacinum TaxID=33203 RepID=A0ABR0C5I3_PURLI|nr:hypothetical protein Purlil1_3905 [Purpureocillium lilacinum]